jgi:hypothetical protein
MAPALKNNKRTCKFAVEAVDGPLFALPASDDFYGDFKICSRTQEGVDGLTVGHPVSAIYIFGLFESELARATSCCAKKSAVQPAESWALTFANQGWTLAIWATDVHKQKKERQKEEK